MGELRVDFLIILYFLAASSHSQSSSLSLSLCLRLQTRPSFGRRRGCSQFIGGRGGINIYQLV